MSSPPRWRAIALARPGRQAQTVGGTQWISFGPSPLAFARRRCIVPADGFFEWARDDGRKVPHWFHPPEGGVFGLAAIRAGATFAVLTAEANADVAPVHHRMPVVVPAGAVDLWLSADAVPGDLRPLLAPAPAGTFAHHPVSPRVNRVEHDDAGLVKPLDEGPDGTGSG